MTRTAALARRWGPDLALATAVVVLGRLEFHAAGPFYTGSPSAAVVVVWTATVVVLARHRPGIALALAWLGALVQLTTGTDVLAVQAAGAWLAYCAACWGSLPTAWLSALSIPASAALVAGQGDRLLLQGHGIVVLSGAVQDARDLGLTSVSAGVALAVLLAVALGLVPWLVGMAVRSVRLARTSRQRQHEAEDARAAAERASVQAQEIAVLQERQAQLARDVHDVVGHSLAVILAQAESAQYLPQDDPERLRRTMANVAGTARSSLQDVRRVLAATDGRRPPAPPDPRGLDGLVEGIRAAGNDVRSTVVGEPRPLPPEIEVVAFRVLQEMLTNALRHGLRGAPVLVEQRWEDRLRLETRNTVPPPPPGVVRTAVVLRDDTGPDTVRDDTGPAGGRAGGGAAPGAGLGPEPEPAGMGLDGMRRRLASVGGSLAAHRSDDGATFVVTAHVPLRPVLRSRPLAGGAWLVRTGETP